MTAVRFALSVLAASCRKLRWLPAIAMVASRTTRIIRNPNCVPITVSCLQHNDSCSVPEPFRTLHTYTNTVKILCEAFKIEFESSAFKCERKLIQQAFSLNRGCKMLVTVIDDAHLMDMENLRKLRLLLEDFPKNHNLILVGQVELLANLDLAVNGDIKSRVTYSVITKRLGDEAMREFIERQLDRIGLAHNTFTAGATELIVRTADGVLRRCRNLCLASMLETVRTSAGTTIDIDVINRVLLQPHWQKGVDLTDF